MLPVLAAVAIGISAAPMEFLPTDDVWVYPHASADQTKDEYLRVWGTNGDAVATNPAEAEDFGYSYLKFNLSKLKKDVPIKSAKLILMHAPDPTWALADAKATPLEARQLEKDFTEKTWEYSMGKTVFPSAGKAAVYGVFAPEKMDAEKPIKFEIDLLRGPAKFVPGADGTVRIALTTALDPSAIGNRAIYKFYSKDYEKAELRPKLVVEAG